MKKQMRIQIAVILSALVLALFAISTLTPAPTLTMSEQIAGISTSPGGG